MGLAHQEELAGEEVLERDQLRVVRDPGIGFLLEGQPDIEPERALPAGAFLGGAHHAAPRAGDDHPPRAGDPLAEGVGLLGDRVRARRPGGAEHGDLRHVAPGREDLEAVADLLERRVGDPDIGHPRAVLVHLERGGEQVGVERPGGLRHPELLEQRVDPPVGVLGLKVVMPIRTHISSIHGAPLRPAYAGPSSPRPGRSPSPRYWWRGRPPAP